MVEISLNRATNNSVNKLYFMREKKHSFSFQTRTEKIAIHFHSLLSVIMKLHKKSAEFCLFNINMDTQNGVGNQRFSSK